MSAERFTIDTNILVYALDGEAGFKQGLCVDILERAARRECVLTFQALSEFYSAVTRKGKVSPESAAAQVEDWLKIYPAVGPTPRALIAAIRHASAGRFSIWDALLLETAADAGCGNVITEDLSDGLAVNGVTIIHPFANGRIASRVDRLLE